MKKPNLKKFEKHLSAPKLSRPKFFIKKSKDTQPKSKKQPKKEVKKVATKLEFPNISRFITEFKFGLIRLGKLTQLDGFWVGLLTGVVLLAVIIVGLNFNKNLEEKKKIETERTKTLTEIKYWQNVTEKYKGYRDGYFKLSLLEYKLGDFEESRKYLGEVFKLDPNFEKGRELERLLNSK